MRIGINKAFQNRRCFPLAALDEASQGIQDSSVCLEKHVMKTHFVATVGRPDVYHRVGVVGDDEMNRFLNQTREFLLELGDILPLGLFHAVTQVDSMPPARLFCALLTDNG